MLTAILFSALITYVSSSDNGGYYTCDLATTFCVFQKSGTAPWSTLTKHNVNISVGPTYQRQIVTDAGVALSLTPKPWTNGDTLAKVPDGSTVVGVDWLYVLAFELVAPLRDLAMYEPQTLANNPSMWEKYTKAFTDCGVKTVDDNSGAHGVAYSTTNVYASLKAPNNQDIHHTVLRFLEEGAIDLVCVMTTLDMDRCTTIRAHMNVPDGKQCNCFIPAYKAIYGADPVLDTELVNCTASPTAPTAPSSDATKTILTSVTLLPLLLLLN